MKIERISDTQVKVILYSDDLADRNINLAELAYGNDKTVGLFREMMEHAVKDCGFKFSNSPLMIEATPLSSDSLMLVITVVSESSLNQESGMNFLREISKIKDFARKNFDGAKGKIKKAAEETSLVSSVASIDDAAFASARIAAFFNGDSQLIKKDGLYYLIIENNQPENRPAIKRLEAVLSEYGGKQNSNALYVSHLREYGEIIIAEKAVSKLCRYIG